MNRKDSVKAYFDISAKTSSWPNLYQKTNRLSYNYLARRRAVESLLEGENYHNVLDVGCGTGDYFITFSDKNIEYIGMDFSEHMIAKAKERFKTMDTAAKFSFKVGDVTALPFDNDSFDLVLAVGLIEYFDSPQELLQSVSRVLKPGGILICQSINRNGLLQLQHWCSRQIQLIKQTFVDLLTKNLSRTSNPKHIAYSKSALDRLLLEFGFQNDDYAYANYGIVPFLENICPVLHENISEKISAKSQKRLSVFASNYIGKYRLADARENRVMLKFGE